MSVRCSVLTLVTAAFVLATGWTMWHRRSTQSTDAELGKLRHANMLLTRQVGAYRQSNSTIAAKVVQLEQTNVLLQRRVVGYEEADRQRRDLNKGHAPPPCGSSQQARRGLATRKR